MRTRAAWTADECPDAHGYITIRRADGTPNGSLHVPPIATVYREADATLIAAAPEMLEALREVFLACACDKVRRVLGDAEHDRVFRQVSGLLAEVRGKA